MLHEHGGDLNVATCAVVRVLCIPSHAKHCLRPSVWSTAVSMILVRDMIRPPIYSDDSKRLHAMVTKYSDDSTGIIIYITPVMNSSVQMIWIRMPNQRHKCKEPWAKSHSNVILMISQSAHLSL